MTAPPPRRPLHAEFFLLAHDGYSGRPHADAALLSAGVAGALLAELALSGHIGLRAGVPLPTGRADAPADPLAASTLDRLDTLALGADRWIELLAEAAYTMAGDELVREGVVARPPAGRLARLTGPRVRYVAADALAAAAPRVLLRHAADQRTTPADARTRVLAALALATGLDAVVADAANRAALGRLRAMAATVHGDPRAIVDAVHTAAARIALTPRRGQ